MTEVYKTNIQEPDQAKRILMILANTLSGLKVNFDLEDCHKILRVEGSEIDSERVISTVNQAGFICEILEDKVCVGTKQLMR